MKNRKVKFNSIIVFCLVIIIFFALIFAKEHEDKIIINSLLKSGSEYGPVSFSHKQHGIDMYEKYSKESCESCHHYSTEASSCVTCHKKEYDMENLNMPYLKGAYHQRCMLVCHKSKTDIVDCITCHPKRKK